MAAVEELKQQIARTPHSPGVYQFKDADQHILYIGKAKDLKKRTSSYLHPHPLDPKIDQMVFEARVIETTITSNEIEALLLEATLIRKHQPPYNVFLKDDRSYAYLRISVRDPYPVIEKVHHPLRDHARYMGPFVSSESVRDLLRVAKHFFPYPSCTVSRVEPCLMVVHGMRVGPLRGEEPISGVYQESIREIMAFLSGKTTTLLQTLESRMHDAAKHHRYEVAASFRDRIRSVQRLQQQQDVLLPRTNNLDIVNIARAGEHAAAVLLRIREGKLLHTHRSVFVHVGKTSDLTLLSTFLTQYYTQTSDIPKTIIVPEKPKDLTLQTYLSNSQFHIPQRGRLRRLLRLCEENAEKLVHDQQLRFEEPEILDLPIQQALQQLQVALRLATKPQRIEMYDISNVQGKFAVGSMVVFEHGRPNKSQYRHFRIRGMDAPNDFAMMQQILERRLSHSTDQRNAWPLPDLILLDGGKGQLTSGLQALENAHRTIPIAALAKRREELFLPNKSESILLPRTSPALFLVQRIRDESHRFAILYYRSRHRKASIQSVLDQIPGIGPKTKHQLLTTFGSIAEMRRASDRELLRVIRPSQLTALRQYL